ncbi:MAG: hypothetical protein HC866_21095 [Leptolyngbyaceae cyanobacterium RU_5_1]|nr:hypothetical protein [Leptolyngbyaceae cyanobacterium RU_5_1]
MRWASRSALARELRLWLQFHNEVTGVTVEDWVAIPAYRADLEARLGSTGCDALKQAVTAQLPTMNRDARVVFDNFLKIIQRTKNR